MAAIDPEKTILMPELDTAEGKAQLVLTTSKYGNGQIVSAAQVQFAHDGMITFMLFGDFRKVYARHPGRATQKTLDAQQAATFNDATIPAILAEVRAFYAEKRAKDAAAAD